MVGAQFSFGQMLARASADVRLRPGDLVGSGRSAAAACSRSATRRSDGYLEPGDVVTLDRAARETADADRGAAENVR